VTFHSVLAGLCPLIPVPFLDDRVLAAVRRKMVRDLAAERGVALDAERVDVLAGIGRERRGCLGTAAWIAFSLTVRLLGKVFRKVLIVFAVKESVDTASRTFHEGYLLHLAFQWAPAWSGAEGEGPAPDALDPGRAVGLRRIVERTVAEADPRPVEQVLRRAFRGSRGLLRRAAGVLRRSARRTESLPESEERRLLGGLLDSLVAELWEEQGYLQALEDRFRGHLTEASAGRPRRLLDAPC
jgi:hypothetical protein